MNDADPELKSCSPAEVARAEAALAGYFQAELPRPWPGAPVVEPQRPKAVHRPQRYFALAASIAVLAVGLGLFSAFATKDETKPLPEGAGPPTAHRPGPRPLPAGSLPLRPRLIR